MPDEDPASQNAFPASAAAGLAELLTEVDEFLRSGPAVAAELEQFLARRGRPYPGFAACNLIDAVSFTALRLRDLTAGNPGCQLSPDSDPD